MLAIAVDSEGGVLFAQSRMGKDGRPFIIFKFRTMYPQAPADTPTGALDDPSRHITPVGRFLRRTSLDELPQLFNILKGDMSFIGPRPVVLAERALIGLRRAKGADRVRPGITGLAQVQGRDEVPARRKACYDAYYARHMGPAWTPGFLCEPFAVCSPARGAGRRRPPGPPGNGREPPGGATGPERPPDHPGNRAYISFAAPKGLLPRPADRTSGRIPLS